MAECPGISQDILTLDRLVRVPDLYSQWRGEGQHQARADAYVHYPGRRECSTRCQVTVTLGKRIPRMSTPYFNLEPRYTPGSPGAVWDHELAMRVAKEEADAFSYAITGSSGRDDQTTAEAKGLTLIVFEMRESTRGWNVFDVITNERWFWPYTATCPTCNKRQVRCARGYLTEHDRPQPKRGTARITPCISREFVGNMVEPK